jgi:hypothetical protein
LDIAADSTGNIYVLLNYNWPYRGNSEILKLDDDGNEIWRLAFPAKWDASPTVIEINQSGQIIIGGDANEKLPGKADDFQGDGGVFLLKMTP